jgi:membrane-associated phospholipid phosphatase
MTIARWLSIIFHPFVMIGVMVGAAAARRQTAGEAIQTVALVVLFTIVPVAILMWRQVRRGTWENVDASNRAERPILYIVGAVAIAALLSYLLLLRPESFMVRGVIAVLGMLAVCGAATRWIKVSLHMAFASLAATALVLMRAPMGYALLLIALPALVWSRLVLKRHTPIEVAMGTAIGVGTAVAIHYL